MPERDWPHNKLTEIKRRNLTSALDDLVGNFYSLPEELKPAGYDDLNERQRRQTIEEHDNYRLAFLSQARSLINQIADDMPQEEALDTVWKVLDENQGRLPDDLRKEIINYLG